MFGDQLCCDLFLTIGFMMTRMMAFQRMEVLANWRGMTVKERGMDSANPNIDARERTAYADQQKIKTPDRVTTCNDKGLKGLTKPFFSHYFRCFLTFLY